VRLALVASLCACLAACASDPLSPDPPELDRARFETDVYPVLARDCAFPACHGAPERFFRVYAPNRARLDPAATPLGAPVTADEIGATYDRARSMLSSSTSPAESLLVRKPLDDAAGGAEHMGRDARGRNVYASKDDPGWRAIAAWAGVAVGGAP